MPPHTITGFLIASTTVLVIAANVNARRMTGYPYQVFPPDHTLNMPVDSLPVHPNSANFIATIGTQQSLHPDFGTSWNNGTAEQQMGIPYNVVGSNQPVVPITFIFWPKESDPGPWPIPSDPCIETVFNWREESSGDRHLLVIDSSTNMLFETGNVHRTTTPKTSLDTRYTSDSNHLTTIITLPHASVVSVVQFNLQGVVQGVLFKGYLQKGTTTRTMQLQSAGAPQLAILKLITGATAVRYKTVPVCR